MNKLFLPAIGNGPAEPVTGEGEGSFNLAFVMELFDLMRNDKGQKRATCMYSNVLQLAATCHCEDMGVHNYFSHVAPGNIWPNQRARQAGYRLPQEWPDAANYIESICAGQPTPAEAWNAWMHSESHSKHLLGLTDFFKAQTMVGIGYYHQPGSEYEHYWCAVSCPPGGIQWQVTRSR